MSPISAYVHIPFCRQKCRYCDFYSAPRGRETVSAYTKALAAQIVSSEARGEGLSTLYFGGGTPSLLSEDEFRTVVAALRETFDCSSLREFTVECNPESVSESLARVWRACGVTRVSMGVQSFDDGILRFLGRIHTADRAREAFRILRRVGFSDIGLDLISAIPGESPERLERDLTELCRLSPEHASVYLLSVGENSEFGRTGLQPPDEEVQRRAYLFADSFLTKNGYEHYEISNFARAGHRSLHNGTYWSGGEYLAFGAGACGFYRNVRYRIPEDSDAYCAANGNLPPICEETLTEADRATERIFLGLRLSEGIEKSRIPPEKEAFVRDLVRSGNARLSEERFSLTPSGFLISDYVIRELIDVR